MLNLSKISKKLAKFKRKKYLVILGLFIALIVFFLLTELMTSQVNACLMNGTLVFNNSCEEKAINWFPLIKK